METKGKKECHLELMDMIIEQMCVAPSGQVDQYVKNKFIKFKGEQHTPSEKFDFINEIGKIPVQKINDKASVATISTFVKELCALEKYYLRPSA
jgi:hypothetical protein